MKRLNIIKILSNRKWKLNPEILLGIHKSLIASLFVYTGFLGTIIAKTNLNIIQRIQNEALRRIYQLPKETKIEDLHRIANIKTISERLHELGKSYIESAIENQNPLIRKLIAEYQSFKGGRNLKRKTILCNFEEVINSNNKFG